MASNAAAIERTSFSIGTVLSRSFGTLGDNPVATFGIAFLFGALPQLLFSYFLSSSLAMADRSSTIGVIAVSFGSYAIFLLFAMLVQGALVQATMAHADGGRASFAQCLGAGLTMAVPLIGLSILMLLGLLVGFSFLLIPGIILYIMWSVAVPALVAEGSGVFAAFGRSRALTKGARWKIFGLFVLMVILLWIFYAVVGVLMLASGTLPMAAMAENGFTPSPVYLLISGVSSTLILAFWGTVQASLYVALRDWKDGPQGSALADIFA